MNVKDQVYFVQLDNSNPSFSFTGYNDVETGETKYIYKGRKDKHGNEVPHRFLFDRAHRTIRAHKNAVDIKGTNIADFLREYPKCGDSKNGSYGVGADGKPVQMNVKFIEIKEAKAAKVAIEAKAIKINAENTALNLIGQDLRDMAILCGLLADDEGVMKHRLIDYAGANPAVFLEFYNSNERTAQSLLIQAVDAKEVTVKGSIYKWGTVTLGVTEDLAVSKLIADKEIAEALDEALKVKGNK